MKRLTFAQLAKLEPALADLLKEAKAAKGGKGFCANAFWYGYGCRGIKPRLLYLVGHLRTDRNPILSTSEAYDVAYQTIYKALPDCNHGDRIGCVSF
jgi:hypothetical protein